MKSYSFAVFILTHGRPEKVYTYKSLMKAGYTGPVYIIIDDEDDKGEEYMKIFGDKVIVFDKLDISQRYDTGDNATDRRSIFYARNASFEIAKKLGIDYFIQLDDDYTGFWYKFLLKGNNIEYCDKYIKNLDAVFEYLIDFYESIPALSIAMAQGGDFIGGSESTLAGGIRAIRKCMNTIICSTRRPYKFIGRINEDVNTYTLLGSQGNLFLTLTGIAIHQVTTQKSTGGMSELYLKYGTYVKSFYTVMYMPSAVKLAMMGSIHRRIHHKISWANCVPQIISEDYKKK